MKILHICAIGASVQTLLLPQIDYLLSRNLSVEIACSPSAEVEELQKQGYIVHPIQIDRRIDPIANLKSIYQLAQLMRQNQYDLVHVHTPIAAALGRIAAKIAGVQRIVYTSHGLPFHDLSTPTQYRFYFIVEKLAALITDLILSQNYEDIATAKKLGLCTPEKLRYLGNGVDIDSFGRDSLNPIHQSELRQSLGIPETANLIVGTIGRLNRKKGSAILIEATAKLTDRFPNLHLMIIGGEINKYTEPFQKELIEKIHNLGIKKHVTFTGIRFDIPEILGLLDVFTLPTFAHEGLPRSILEAMAMELPVVTTDIRGCREAVLQDKTGLIVPPQDSDKLAEALAIMLSNSELRQAYGKAGRHRVTTKYNEELVFERLTKYYQELGIK